MDHPVHSPSAGQPLKCSFSSQVPPDGVQGGVPPGQEVCPRAGLPLPAAQVPLPRTVRVQRRTRRRRPSPRLRASGPCPTYDIQFNGIKSSLNGSRIISGDAGARPPVGNVLLPRQELLPPQRLDAHLLLGQQGKELDKLLINYLLTINYY